MIQTGIALAALLLSTTLMSPTSAWSQSDWKAPADAKKLKNPIQGYRKARKSGESGASSEAAVT